MPGCSATSFVLIAWELHEMFYACAGILAWEKYKHGTEELRTRGLEVKTTVFCLACTTASQCLLAKIRSGGESSSSA